MPHAEHPDVILVAENYLFLILIAAAVLSRWFWPTEYVERAPRYCNPLTAKLVWFLNDALLIVAYFAYFLNSTHVSHHSHHDLTSTSHDTTYILIFIHLLLVQYQKLRFFKYGASQFIAGKSKRESDNEAARVAKIVLYVAWLLQIAVGIGLVVWAGIQSTWLYFGFILAQVVLQAVWITCLACECCRGRYQRM